MKSFMPMPQQMIVWKCPNCGKEEITTEQASPWIQTYLPFSFGKPKAPVCSKCKIKMIKVETF